MDIAHVGHRSPSGGTRRRIALVGGGTAGHVYPALAVAEAYCQAYDHVELLFIGTADSCEAQLVPSFGYRFRPVRASQLFGVDSRGKARAMLNLTRGMGQARRLLRAHGTKLVIGFGGYASAGALLAARGLGLRTAIHEGNMVPGLTNRLLGRFVDWVYLGFEDANGAFVTQRTRVTGNPVRASVTHISPTSRAVRRIGQPLHILVMGGSQGSPFFNQHVPGLLRRVAEYGLALDVWHQVGNFDSTPVQAAYASAGLSVSVVPYIDDIATAYAWADFAITCSGSGTISELAVCGLPALLVPLPNVAQDHQTVNAELFAKTGAAWWLREADWQVERLASQLAAWLRDPEARATASQQARRLATPGAAQTLVADCEVLMAR